MISDFKKEVARFEKSAEIWNSRTKPVIKPKNLLQKRARPERSESGEIPVKKREVKLDEKVEKREKKVIKYKEDESDSSCPEVPAAKNKRAPKVKKPT